MLPEDIWIMIWKTYYTVYVIPEINKLNKIIKVTSNEIFTDIICLTFQYPIGYTNEDLIWLMGKSTWPTDIGYSSDIGQPYFTIRYHQLHGKCERINVSNNIFYTEFTRSLKNVIYNHY
tara:strand:+ start:1408 stop:1764 length:357 start_codon:yes stop_codon:yes gene_type:complete